MKESSPAPLPSALSNGCAHVVSFFSFASSFPASETPDEGIAQCNNPLYTQRSYPQSFEQLLAQNGHLKVVNHGRFATLATMGPLIITFFNSPRSESGNGKHYQMEINSGQSKKVTGISLSKFSPRSCQITLLPHKNRFFYRP